MNMQTITYGCTALAGTNLVGDLQFDKNGYTWVVLGALSAFNSAGAFYELEESRLLFENDAELMRRIANACLRGETGHPRFQEGMSERAWFARVSDIFEPNCCVHIAEVKLSYDTLRDKQGRKVVAVMGLVRPSGQNEAYLMRQMQNPKENVCFSVRSFTHDSFERGIRIKRLKKIITWDVVNEPGISVANKYSNPALESYQAPLDIDGYDFSIASLEQFAQDEADAGVSMESGQAHATEILQMVSHIPKKIQVFVPLSLQLAVHQKTL